MSRFLLALTLITAVGSSIHADDAKNLSPTHADVSYGPHKMNVLDFWKAQGEGPRPLLVYIHGGGWIGGDKKQANSRFQPFLDKGISYAAVNYRLTGEASLPAPVARPKSPARPFPWFKNTRAGDCQCSTSISIASTTPTN